MTVVSGAIDPGARHLLQEAVEWRLIGRLLECPVGDWRDDVARLSQEVATGELRAAAEAGLAVATEGQYHSIFGPGGPAPPREVSYHETLELGSLMSELAAYYDGFGYRPATKEAPDHVAVEVGFVAYLRLKQAYAVTAGDDERAALTDRTVERFCSDHLALIAEPLSALLEESGLDYLARATRILFLRVGPRRARTSLRVLATPPDADADGCGCPVDQPPEA